MNQSSNRISLPRWGLVALLGILPLAWFPFAFRQLTVKDIASIAAATSSILHSTQWVRSGKELVYLAVDPETRHALYRATDPATGKSRLLLDVDSIKSKFSSLTALSAKSENEDESPAGFVFSPDFSTALFAWKGDVYEYSLLSAGLKRWTYSPEEESDFRYSPDGAKIAFVRNNNVFLIDRERQRELQVTRDGNRNLTYGTVDWVIGEEFDLREGYWWSPDSRYLAILRLDEGSVPEYPLTDWLPRHPRVTYQKYPKAGDPNPLATLVCFDVEKNSLRVLSVGGSPDEYLPRVCWTLDSSGLLVQVLSRDQKRLRLLVVDRETDLVRPVLEESSPCWLNVHQLLYLFSTRREFLWGSERDGHMHVYRYNLDGTLIRRLTEGPWDVTAINDVDEIEGKWYFTATEKSPLERHLYLGSIDSTAFRRVTQAVGTHRVSISPDHISFFETFTDGLIPPTQSIGRLDNPGKAFVLQKPDSTLREQYGLRDCEYLTVKSPSGAALQACMIKPPDFDPARRYPVIVYVYGGPGAQVVTRDWSSTYMLWHQMMAQKGFIIFSLDNHGSTGRGKSWEEAVHLQLGKQELLDQLAGVEYLKTLPYVDSGKIGIWGWSYGGYMTCFALANAPGVFKAGTAVAPVTDWLNYDTIYTERYMGLPSANPNGYRDSSPIHQIQALSGNLLLVHGTSDDNVHLQNSIQMLDALIKSGNKQFQIMYYPLMDHGIREPRARTHLFETITNFFELNLK